MCKQYKITINELTFSQEGVRASVDDLDNQAEELRVHLVLMKTLALTKNTLLQLLNQSEEKKQNHKSLLE